MYPYKQSDRLKKYPWQRTQPGESFFVPALDITQTILEGRQAAAQLELRGISYKAGVYNGILGVMFKRR